MLITFKKNIIALSLTLATLLSILTLPATAAAQGRPGFINRHRTAVTIVGGTLAGAGIGGLAGGRKGALIGSLVGAGGSSIFEAVRVKRQHDRERAYYRHRLAQSRYYNSRARSHQGYRY